MVAAGGGRRGGGEALEGAAGGDGNGGGEAELLAEEEEERRRLAPVLEVALVSEEERETEPLFIRVVEAPYSMRKPSLLSVQAAELERILPPASKPSAAAG